jgi:hypothetical protein
LKLRSVAADADDQISENVSHQKLPRISISFMFLTSDGCNAPDFSRIVSISQKISWGWSCQNSAGRQAPAPTSAA